MIAIHSHPFAHQYHTRRHGCRKGRNCRSSRSRFPHAQVDDLDSKILLSVELPGVKTSDVSVVENDWVLAVSATRGNGAKEIKFERNFPLNKKEVDVEGIEVSLSDGILSILIPKKPAPVSRSVPVTLQYAPEKKENDFHAVFEVPGVKPDNMQISVTGDELSIVAKRMMGGSTSVSTRTFTADEDIFDTESTSAYLADGILTLVFLKKEASVKSAHSFVVNSAPAVAPATKVENVKPNAQDDTTESDEDRTTKQPNEEPEVVLETVADEDVEKEVKGNDTTPSAEPETVVETVADEDVEKEEKDEWENVEGEDM